MIGLAVLGGGGAAGALMPEPTLDEGSIGAWEAPAPAVSESPQPSPEAPPTPDPGPPAPVPAPDTTAQAGDRPRSDVPQPNETDEQRATREKAQKETRDAINKAREYLSRTECASGIGSSKQTGETAIEVLLKVDAVGTDRIIDLYTSGQILPTDSPMEYAEPIGAGSTGRIYLFESFHAASYDPKVWFPNGPGSASSLDMTEFRAYVILHAVAHLTGKLSANHNGDRAAFDTTIIKNCVRPTPPAVPGGGGVGGDAAHVPLPPIDGGLYPPPLPPVFTTDDPALPDGDGTPSLGECCEEAPPGSYDDPGYDDPGYGDAGYEGEAGTDPFSTDDSYGGGGGEPDVPYDDYDDYDDWWYDAAELAY